MGFVYVQSGNTCLYKPVSAVYGGKYVGYPESISRFLFKNTISAVVLPNV